MKFTTRGFVPTLILSVSLAGCGPKEEEESTPDPLVTFPKAGECVPQGVGKLDGTFTNLNDEGASEVSLDCLVTPSVNNENILHFQFYDQLIEGETLSNLGTLSVTVHTVTEPGEFPLSSNLTEGKSYVAVSFRDEKGADFIAEKALAPYSTSVSGSIMVSSFTPPPNGTVMGEFKNVRLKFVKDEEQQVVLTGSFSVEGLQ